MTTNEKITAIENKIRGECKWLMELSFGCKIIINTHNAVVIQDEYTEENDGLNSIIVRYEDCDQFEEMRIMREKLPEEGNGDWQFDFKIIGHPIHLSDLLYVIGKQWGGKITIETPEAKENDIEDYYTGMQVQKILFLYNYSLSFKKNLEQSPELVEFLFNLICK